MRLISWNTNYNSKRRTHEEDVAFLWALDADILVLSETAAPHVPNSSNTNWIGDVSPGLAVVAPEGLSLEAHRANNSAPSLLSGFHISGDLNFFLLAAWPVHLKGEQNYHAVLMSALELFGDSLGQSPAVMAGDFNSSTRVSKQRSSHPKFVDAAKKIGLVSVYHFHTGELHGQESVATYRHAAGGDSEFHIDYCFVSFELASAATVSVQRSDQWVTLSDHYPLVLDIPDSALAA